MKEVENFVMHRGTESYMEWRKQIIVFRNNAYGKLLRILWLLLAYLPLLIRIHLDKWIHGRGAFSKDDRDLIRIVDTYFI